jgi:ABC-2 type transport system permease protein
VSPTRAILDIAALHLRRRRRDRSALIQGILAPVILALIISLAFGGGRSFSASIAVVDADRSAVSAPIANALVGDGGDGAAEDSGVRFVPRADEAAATRAIDDGDVAAAVVLPAGFGAAVAAGDPPEMRVLVDAGAELAGDVAEGVARGLTARLDATRIAVGTSLVLDPALAGDLDAVITTAAAAPTAVALGESAFGAGFDPVTYFAPSMAILFGFLTLGAGARSVIVERREGTLVRVRAAPVSDRAVLAGITLAVLVLGLVSFLTVWLVTAVAFGARWGDPLAVFVVIVATVLAIAGISTLITALARTEAQADSLSAIVAFGFALLGGGFLSPGDLPDVLAVVARLTPNGWALAAFAELSAGASGLAAVWPSVVVLLGIGVVTGAVGLGRIRLGAS